MNSFLFFLSNSFFNTLFIFYICWYLSIKSGNDYYSLSVGYSLTLALFSTLFHIFKEIQKQPELMAQFRLILKWTMISLKTLVLGSIWITILPLLVGFLIELIVVTPFWAPESESPSYSFLQSWAIGLLSFTAWIRYCTKTYFFFLTFSLLLYHFINLFLIDVFCMVFLALHYGS